MSLAGSYNGLSFGPGTKVHVGGVLGLDDLPGIRSFDADRAADHGGWGGRDLVATRVVELTLHLIGDDFNDYAALVGALEAAFTPQLLEQPLYLYGSTRLVFARPRKLALPYQADRFSRTGTAVVQLLAMDPRVYDAALQQPAVGLATSSSGFGFPLAFNFGFGAGGTGGFVTVTNLGNFPTRPVVTIQGPADTPVIENTTAGKFLKFNLSLASTDVLTVDLDAHSVLLNGTASRRNALSADSQWWELAPGVSSIRFRANAYQAAALATLAFRSAWMGKGGVV